MAKRLSPVASLKEGLFGSKRDDLPPADPTRPMHMEVEIGNIELYDRNPRRIKNQVYEALRDSIASVGLDAPITITRRPGAERYMVAGGGNTRLMIVKELYAASQDPRFSRVYCLFRPWASEIEVLAAHLRENDLRADLVFIDHAHAIMGLKTLLEDETGEPISIGRPLEKKLKDLGHDISRRDLSRMEYAVNTLQPLIPTALQAGLGPYLIDRIHQIHRNYRDFYSEKIAGSDRPAFTTLFEAALAASDDEAIDLEQLRRDLDHRIAQIGGQPSNRVRLAVDAFSLTKPAASAAPPDLAEFSNPSETPTADEKDFVPATASTVIEPDWEETADVAAPPTPEAEILDPDPQPSLALSSSPEPPAIQGEPVPPRAITDRPADRVHLPAFPTAEPPVSIGAPAVVETKDSSFSQKNGPVYGLRQPAFPASDHAVRSNTEPSEAASAPEPSTACGQEIAPRPTEPEREKRADDFELMEVVSPASANDGSSVPDAAANPVTNPAPPTAAEERAIAPLDNVTYLNPYLEGGREHLPRSNDVKSLRSRIFMLAMHLAASGGIRNMVVEDKNNPIGIALLALPADATEQQTMIWWLLASLAGVPVEGSPRAYACLDDPAAFLSHFLFRWNSGKPPSDQFLRNLFLLIEAIVALGRATIQPIS